MTSTKKGLGKSMGQVRAEQQPPTLKPVKATKGTAESFFDMVVGLEEEAKTKGKATGLLVTPFFEYHVMVSTRDGKAVEVPHAAASKP